MLQAGELERERASDGLELMVILGENAAGGEPTLEDCSAYAQTYGVSPSRVFIDYGGTFGGWSATFSNISTYSGGSIGLPWTAVLRGSNLEYVASDYALQEYGSVREAALSLLEE